jgi:hypothetical protein
MFRASAADTISMKARAFVLAVGAVYVVTLTAMFAYGWELPAAYLAMPAWYFVSYPFFALTSSVPGTMDLLGWNTWNTLLLMLSGSLNVSAAYWIAKKLDRA